MARSRAAGPEARSADEVLLPRQLNREQGFLVAFASRNDIPLKNCRDLLGRDRLGAELVEQALEFGGDVRCLAIFDVTALHHVN
jgi:hypothetical protein